MLTTDTSQELDYLEKMLPMLVGAKGLRKKDWKMHNSKPWLIFISCPHFYSKKRVKSMFIMAVTNSLWLLSAFCTPHYLGCYGLNSQMRAKQNESGKKYYRPHFLIILMSHSPLSLFNSVPYVYIPHLCCFYTAWYLVIATSMLNNIKCYIHSHKLPNLDKQYIIFHGYLTSPFWNCQDRNH